MLHRLGGDWRSYGLWRCNWCRRIRQHAFDDRLLAVVLFLTATRHRRWVFNVVGHFVAGLDIVKSRVVVFQALKAVVGRLERFIRHQQHVDALLHFNFADF